MDLYREQMMDHYRHPRNHQALTNPTHQAQGINPLCGDQIEVFLNVRDNLINDIGFQSQSCAITTATASLVTEQLRGQPASHLQSFTVDKIQELLGTPLSSSRINCAMVVIEAFKKALEQNGKK